jgi:hypothetical protein
MHQHLRLRVFVFAVAIIIAWPVISAQAQEPPWVQLLDKILPMTTKLVQAIFQKPDSTELKNKVSKKDAEKKLGGLSEDLKKAAQPLNEEVRKIIAWRQFTDELNGIGSLPKDGSFRSSIVQIKTYAEASSWYSDGGLSPAISKVENLYATAGNQWGLLWKISQQQPMPDNVRSDLNELRTRFTDLGESIVSAKKADNPKLRRSSLETVTNKADAAKVGIDRLLSAWDSWLRELGTAFITYMTKFGATPDDKVKQDNQKRASVSMELDEAQEAVKEANERFQIASSQLKDAEEKIAEAAAQPRAQTGNSGQFASADVTFRLLEEKRDSLRSQESQLRKQIELESNRVRDAKKSLEQLHARRLLSVEDLLNELAAEETGEKH